MNSDMGASFRQSGSDRLEKQSTDPASAHARQLEEAGRKGEWTRDLSA